MKPRAKTFERWLRANLGMGYIKELAEHGTDSGFPHLTYTSDMQPVYFAYEREIWDALGEDAEDQGCNIPALISEFGRADMAEDPNNFRALLVWYMAERTARDLTER